MATRNTLPEGFIQEVLSRTDIAEIVGRHVALRKGGANLLGLCPFHGEKSPSFTVSPAKQFYHCFGCGAHGDAIRFLMEITGAGFLDTVKDLAQQAGLKVPEAPADPAEREQAQRERSQQQGLVALLTRACEHYRERLKSDERAVAYLKRRGLTGAIARDFALGYAPPGWRSLASTFAQYDDPALVEAGLVIVQGDDETEQKRYDRFRDRIMFPIRSPKGEVIGFGGRVLDAGEPKYLNSPETPVFVKGRELYGLFEGRQAIRERGYALVVEGYMDVVALAQSGLGHAVATLGTACTADHVRKLLRFTDHVVFSFDGDAAGRRAAGRALEAALPHVSDLRSFRFLFLPAEHDPDSYVREHGASAFEALVAAAPPLSAQLLERAADEADLATPEGRARMLAQAKPMWQAIPECALKRQILTELASTGRLEPDVLARMWGLAVAGRTQGAKGEPLPRRTRRAVPVPLPQDHVTRMLLTDSQWWQELDGADREMLASLGTWHAALFVWLEADLTEHGPSAWPALRERLSGQAFEDQARRLVDEAEFVPATTRDELIAAVRQTSRSLALQDPLRLLGRA